MSVQLSEQNGWFNRLWSAFWSSMAVGSNSVAARPAHAMPAPIALDRQVVVHARFGSSPEFMLAARLASAQSLNSPVLRRNGKAAVTPRVTKAVPALKAKPKTVEATVKKIRPARVVWLSARPEQRTSAEIVKFVPRSQRQSITRAA